MSEQFTNAPGRPAPDTPADSKEQAAQKRARRERKRARKEAAAAGGSTGGGTGGGTGGAQRAAADRTVIRVRPMAKPARFKLRHMGLLFAFLIMVAVPVGAAYWYLETRAIDQYASTLGFTVRNEEAPSATDLLGGVGAALGGGGTKDSDILYEFIRSQELVAIIDAQLDLQSLYSRHYDVDPVFGLAPDGTIEDLTAYWDRMVRISYDSASGLMELSALAFEPDEAKAIAEAIFTESSRMINDLSAIARADATAYATVDLERALERLKEAREAITAFRIENEIVDVSADIQGQMGLLNTLQQQLANALIEFDLLRNGTRETDPRLEQAQARIDVIEARIEEERQKFGAGGGPGGTSYAATVAEFESLTVDREFAEASYLAALQAFEVARADASRQSRYLAAYIRPTLAEASEFPQRPLILGLVGLFSFLAWMILSVIFYALRDRN